MSSAAATRSVPEASAGSVMMASPPCTLTALAIGRSAAATSTRPTLASTARFHTCTIIGRALMSAKGLPGSLRDAIRAGITTIVFWFSIMELGGGAANCSG